MNFGWFHSIAQAGEMMTGSVAADQVEEIELIAGRADRPLTATSASKREGDRLYVTVWAAGSVAVLVGA